MSSTPSGCTISELGRPTHLCAPLSPQGKAVKCTCPWAISLLRSIGHRPGYSAHPSRRTSHRSRRRGGPYDAAVAWELICPSEFSR